MLCCVVLLCYHGFSFFLWYLLTLIPLRMDKYEAGMDVRMSGREERDGMGWASKPPSERVYALYYYYFDGIRLLDLGWKATGPSCTDAGMGWDGWIYKGTAASVG